MIDDLVERLRQMQEWTFAPVREAADRIEKLEAALREIAAPDWDGESYPDEIARKALEKKDD